jgi:hypothetical protein
MPSENIPVWVSKTDWPLLASQKLQLLSLPESLNPEDADPINGVVHFLDAIQDWAVGALGLPEEAVFGAEEPIKELPPRRFERLGKVLLGAYHVERRYGGREEGGWYYDWYDHIESRCVPQGDAEAAEKQLGEKYPDDGRELSSVLSTGRTIVLREKRPAEHQSTERPRYE